MAEVVVDVAAAAARVRKQNAGQEVSGQPQGGAQRNHGAGTQAGTPAPEKDAQVLAGKEPPVACPLGHETPAGFRFCPTCGIPIGAMVLTERVDLQAAAQQVKPAAVLSPEERAEREAQHMAAMQAAAAFERAPQIFADDTSKERILIHFLEDGLTFAGQVWLRGQELEIGPENPRWQSALRWITLDRWGQIDRYGKHMFDTGPWPGRKLSDLKPEDFQELRSLNKSSDATVRTVTSAEDLRNAEFKERERARRAPAPLYAP